ncbi:hypothetical protein BT96DRAFT_458605 [Gymnopus androsaceus JB14]|uniref:Uncharacterized protein n=1 Tax=Gymnopus androsaceus JB14 TaxID=1447944 RepID=A0A6A4ILV1_9AGAR|nr:hypothetical protein BT96DRAFT_458605 [Gymnopus androsaceus JB14]
MPLHLPMDRRMGRLIGSDSRGVSVIMLGDLGPEASNTVLRFAEENAEGEDKELLTMAEKLIALVVNARTRQIDLTSNNTHGRSC